MSEEERRREAEREKFKGTTFDPELHDMGGDVGPASIRGSNAKPGGDPNDDAAPRSGWSEPMGYMAGPDDEQPGTAGSDAKAVGARTDDLDHVETVPGPSPSPMPEGTDGPYDRPEDAARRARGPVEDGPDDDGPRPDRTAAAGGGHVGAGLDWVSGDEDDPDGGSGRTGEDDGGYLPGEGTGRPFR
ncbi:hypothetical protein Ppa06_01280 [Planomonospora parontospora subsp. parontospora]|uniref:Uncharacterized protein n=2 Tax=Planomonospora parontospora TaxID=58119 RepID=A0AA37F200_9ACTN|nr:hypothetical protein [Planomonospora parontospora]GGK45501.1 hypothetical protein GCM10010126_01280 [Planomonospora parontospora]GII06330.1 hypothetical protein Ppa06_01280 [Planomonospora parontospora subsp. parontospora]